VGGQSGDYSEPSSVTPRKNRSEVLAGLGAALITSLLNLCPFVHGGTHVASVRTVFDARCRCSVIRPHRLLTNCNAAASRAAVQSTHPSNWPQRFDVPMFDMRRMHALEGRRRNETLDTDLGRGGAAGRDIGGMCRGTGRRLLSRLLPWRLSWPLLRSLNPRIVARRTTRAGANPAFHERHRLDEERMREQVVHRICSSGNEGRGGAPIALPGCRRPIRSRGSNEWDCGTFGRSGFFARCGVDRHRARSHLEGDIATRDAAKYSYF
jgi:hypothetical protein